MKESFFTFQLLLVVTICHQKMLYITTSCSSVQCIIIMQGRFQHIPTNYMKVLGVNLHNARACFTAVLVTLRAMLHFLFWRGAPQRGGRKLYAVSLEVFFLAISFPLGKTEQGVCRECPDLGLDWAVHPWNKGLAWWSDPYILKKWAK